MNPKCGYENECEQQAEFFCDCQKFYCFTHSHGHRETEHKQISINEYLQLLYKHGKSSLKNLKNLKHQIITEGNNLMAYINKTIAQSLQTIASSKKSILSLINNFGQESEIKKIGDLTFSCENRHKLHEQINDLFEILCFPKEKIELPDLTSLKDSISQLKEKIQNYQSYIIDEKLLSANHTPEISSCLSEIHQSKRFIHDMAKSISQPKKIASLRCSSKSSLKDLHSHARAVNSVCVSASGKFIVSGSEDGAVRIWDFHEKRLRTIFQDHKGKVESVTISQDEKYIVSCDSCKTIIVWSIIDNSKLFILSDNILSASYVAISYDNEYIIGGGSQTVKIWNFKSRTMISSYSHAVNFQYILSVAITRISRYAVSGSTNGTIKIFDFIENNEKWTIQALSPVYAMLVSYDEKFIVGGLENCLIKIWGFNERELLFTLKGHKDGIKSISASKNFNYLVSGSYKGDLIVWNLLSKTQEIFLGLKSSVNSISITDDDNYAFVALNNPNVKFLKIQSKVNEILLSGHADLVTCVCVSWNGEFAVSGSLDKTVRFWSVKEKSLLFSLNGHRSGIKAVSLSFDLKFIGSVDEFCEFIVWNVRIRKEIFRVPGFSYFTQTKSVCDNRLIEIEGYQNYLKVRIVSKKID